ncbi:MAG: sigma-70 family RNA polymerase sigma factor [Candidatus Poribacteria bacterium]|nr:sigma-70 family RNA polymerase sigma factor [Candidatus Poribacteria bacterium]
MKNIDVKLIYRVLDGDDGAFAELVDKYQKQVHALVWRKIGDFHIAEEITQDTFLRAYQKLGTLKQPQRFASWLYVIAANRSNTWLRKKCLRKQLLEDKEIAQSENSDYSEYVLTENERITVQTQRVVVKKLLAKLEESERTVMTLHYFGDMSCPEIGKFLGVSTNTVKSRLHRAKLRLQKEEVIIREALDNFKITPNLTDNIIREISHTKSAPPASSKPLMPWAVAASTLAVVLLILGFGNSKYMTRFQQPYSLDANAEMTVEILDTPLVANLESKSDTRSQIRRANAQEKIENPKNQLNDSTENAAEVQSGKITEDYTKWHLPKAAKARLGKGGINVLQYSPDASKLAVGSNIGVWIYDVKTGKEVTMFPGACQSLAFSPDGRFLANGGSMFGGGGKFRGKELQLWEVATGKKMALSQAIPPAPALHFSDDGKTLYSVGKWGDTIGIINIETGEVSLKNIGGRPKSLAPPVPYALTHGQLAVVRDSGEIQLLNTNSGKKLSALRGNNDKVLVLAFSPDGTQLASGSVDNAVRLWGTISKEKPTIFREILEKPKGWTNVIAFSPDGKMLASGSTDKNVRLWDILTGKLIGKLTGHSNGIAALSFSPDGTTLASASTDGNILFWNTKTRNQLHIKISGHSDWIKGVTFLRDSTTLVSVAFNGTITLWDLKTLKKTVPQMETYQDLLLALVFSPDGTEFVSVGSKGNVLFEAGHGMSYSSIRSDQLIRLKDVHTGHDLHTLPEGEYLISAAFSPDGKTVALGGVNVIRLWNTETGSFVNIPLSDKLQNNQNGDIEFPQGVNPHNLLPHTEITSLEYSPDSKKLVYGTMGGWVEMLDAGTGITLTTMLAGQNLADAKNKKPRNRGISFDDPITDLAFSSDSVLLAVASEKKIRLLGSEKEFGFEEVRHGAKSLQFSPDNSVLVAGLRHGEIELWDLATGVKLTSLDGHSEPVETLIFSPDGKTLVSTGQDGTILIWDWDEVLKGTDQDK